MKTHENSLFDKIHIQGHQLSNRLVVSPMTRRSATMQGVPTPEMVDYYTAFAVGGFGMIITEGTYTADTHSQTHYNQPGITNQQQQEGWHKVVTSVHRHGALIINQLMHSGGLSQISEQNIAPSAVQPAGIKHPEPGESPGSFPIPRAMTTDDLQQVKEGYVRSARLAYEAGFDGIEIHAANGYLFDQFITEHTNMRTDGYGGNTRNRLRFLMEVYTAIRAVLPAGFIIGIRLSESKVNDLTYRWPGGSATATAIFTVLKELDADYFHLAAEGGNWARECLYADGQSSNSIAKILTGKPIIANGGLHDTTIAASLLSTGRADLIAIGKAAIANPNWPNLIATGQQTIPFFKEMINPSLTLRHTATVLKQYESA
jgi:2,4-dienoyl-CoA reductase-like NADH-dependent reductase (Old Yellow Enzyme family)